jgi:cysteine synthase B
MSVLESIGNTPLIEIIKLNPSPERVRILAKLEGANPGGSVKDRIALSMIDRGFATGGLTLDKVVLEATSGNTGIGLAMVCAAKGLKLKLTMPECVSLERRSVLTAFGTELELTPANEGTDGAIRRAHQIIDENEELYYMPNQFENPANPEVHYNETGREIWEQTKGEVTHFVSGMGTTGTLMGAGRRLRQHNPKIKVIGAEPVIGHKIQGLKNMHESIVPGVYDASKVDYRVSIIDEKAFDTTRQLATIEGVFVGMSSGAALWAALQVAKDLPAGSTVVTVFPDRGDRYLSTNLFTSICAQCPP